MTIRGRLRIDPKSSSRRLPPHLAKYQRKAAAPAARKKLPGWAKCIAVSGIVVFWLASLGWLPSIVPGRQIGLGFKLFCFAQVPLLWCWIKVQARQLRSYADREQDERF